MAGSHLAPSSSSRPNKNRSHEAESARRARERASEREYERGYDPDLDLDYDDDQDYEQETYSRSYDRYSRGYDDYDRGGRRGGGGGGGGGWKTAVLVILLIVVLAAIGFLLWRMFGAQIMGLIGGGGKQTPPPVASVAPGITTQVTAEYENGKSVSGNMSISESSKRLPEELADSQTAQVLDVTWNDNKTPSEPVYVTVSDPDYTDGDGLAVYSFKADELIPDEGEWSLIGTYAIRDGSVTFRADDPAAFALEVISANPTPTDTPMPSAQPLTPTPMPTPSPTPAPIIAVDYGMYGQIQSGVYAQVDEIEDDEVYVMALVRNMPAGSSTSADETIDEAGTGSEATDGGMTISYVDADTSANDAAGAIAPDTAAAPAVYNGPVASVLMNVDGTTMRTVDMNMFQTEDGTWCLDGDITAGMLWTSNRDYYNNGYRYSLGNNEAYINLGDNDNMILNDNHVRTRFLIEDVEVSEGNTIQTLTYADDGRHYINKMEMIPDAVTADDFPATGNASDDDDPGQVIPSGMVLYLGSGLMPESDAVSRDLLQFTVSDEPADAMQVMLFKLDEAIQAPASSTTAPTSRIMVPAVDETTNLSLLEVRDGDRLLQNGVDYTVNARVYNDTVVVTVRFMGNYSGQVVRTYPGTKVLCNDVFAEASPSPSPSASPSPTPSADPNQTTPQPQTGTEPGPVQSNQPADPGTSTPQAPPPTEPTPNNQPQSTPNQQENPPSGGNTPASGTDTGPSGGESPTDTNG